MLFIFQTAFCQFFYDFVKPLLCQLIFCIGKNANDKHNRWYQGIHHLNCKKA